MHMSMRRAVAAYAGPQQDPAIAMLQVRCHSTNAPLKQCHAFML